VAAKMKLQILTPERCFFEGEAEGLIVTIPDGELCILPGHMPSVAPLMVGSLKMKIDGEWQEAFTTEGYLEVGSEATFVFVQACEWPEEINTVWAKQALEESSERLRQRQSIQEYKSTQINLARAMARLRVSSHRNINNQ